MILVGVSLAFGFAVPSIAQPSVAETEEAMHRAVKFFRTKVSAGGGYIYRCSQDLKKREGEGVVGPTTAWIEPPGTPSVGQAYLTGFQLCDDPLLLEAAKVTAEALIRGQLLSGGWDNRIEYAPEDRKRFAYRVDPPTDRKRFNVTTLDDDKSQSAVRFLMRLDQELRFADKDLHAATIDALDSLVEAQYRNGAWPQRYDGADMVESENVTSASLPRRWSRVYSKKDYSRYYTLNDNTISDVIETLLDGWEVYGDHRYLAAAIRGGDFFRLAQLPEPQPGWAQQYDQEMHPAWARKFEPPAISGGESQGVMMALISLYRRTHRLTPNSKRFLEPIPRALAYYRRSLLDDGRLARFYELETNRPLFFTRQYELTYQSDDLPTHYGFIVSSKLDRIERELERAKMASQVDKHVLRPTPPQATESLGRAAQNIIDALDDRGAWVEEGRLRYHGDEDPTTRVIESSTFSKNLVLLARWIGAMKSQKPIR